MVPTCQPGAAKQGKCADFRTFVANHVRISTRNQAIFDINCLIQSNFAQVADTLQSAAEAIMEAEHRLWGFADAGELPSSHRQSRRAHRLNASRSMPSFMRKCCWPSWRAA
jgi:hypothetical protein